MPGRCSWRPFFLAGLVSRAGPAPTAGAGFFGRSGSWSRWWVGCGCWWLVAEADAGASGAAFPRWSVGTISTMKRSAWCARSTRWAGRGVKGTAGWFRVGAGCWANRNGPAAEAAGPGGTLASGGVIRLGFCGDGRWRPDRPDRCRRAAWWLVRGQRRQQHCQSQKLHQYCRSQPC